MYLSGSPSAVDQETSPADWQAPFPRCGFSKTLWAVVLTTRPGSSLIAGTLTASAAFAGKGHFIFRGAAAGFAMTALTMFGFVVNDIFDYSKDRAAGIQRPLATGKLSMTGAIRAATTALLCALVTWVLVGAGPMLLAVVSILLVLYSPLARHYPVYKDFYVAMLCCAPLYYGALIGGGRYAFFSYFSLACFVFGREVLMDADELAGDRKCGMKTIAAILGQHQCMCLGLTLMILASGVTVLVVHGRVATVISLFALALLAGIFAWPSLNPGRLISWSRVPMLFGSMALACGGFAQQH